MKTFYAFNDAPVSDRLAVYDNYTYQACKYGNNNPLDFEEFCLYWTHHSFHYVKAIYCEAD